LTKEWAAKYGEGKVGKSGEIVYESMDARITLFMGKDAKENQKFLKKAMAADPRMILTFRGHSFSLDNNMPSDIFGNDPKAKILFIPGSCGSAGSIPDYLANNPKSSLEFVGNTSTGRGQVTNALLDIFISESARKLKRPYEIILHNDNDSVMAIERAGGTPGTIKATTIGEMLLAYIYSQD
jgi:hypothetical protein